MKKKELKKDYLWNTIGSFIISITSLIYSFILTRTISLDLVGIFSFGFSFACMMTSLAAFGGRTYQITDTKKEKKTSSYIIARYITVITTCIIVFIFLFIKNYTIEKNLVIILLCIFKFSEELSDVYYGIIQTNNNLYKVGQYQFSKSIINVILFITSIFTTKKLILTLLLITINNLIYTYFIERRQAKKLETWNIIIDKTEIKDILKINFYICGYVFFSSYLINASKYSIDIYLSNEIQAIFNILMMPATLMLLVGGFIINPILIDIAKIYKKNDIEQLKKIIKKIILILSIIGIIIITISYFLGTEFLTLIYGLDLNMYKIQLTIVLLGATLYTLVTILGNILIAFRKIKIQFFISLACAIIAAIISNIFVKYYGLNGGFYTYLISMIIRLFCYLPLLYKILKKEKSYEKK